MNKSYVPLLVALMALVVIGTRSADAQVAPTWSWGPSDINRGCQRVMRCCKGMHRAAAQKQNSFAGAAYIALMAAALRGGSRLRKPSRQHLRLR